MNKVCVIGNLARDPELRTTVNTGVSVCTFTLAVNRRGKNDAADFIPVVAWRELGELCARYLRKGKKAAVWGEMQTRSYEDEGGVRRYVTEIIAAEVEFLSPNEAAAPPADEYGYWEGSM